MLDGLSSSGGNGDQSRQLDEVIGRHRQCELEGKPVHAAEHWACQTADGLAPAERLLNQLVLLLADLVIAMASCAAADGERRRVVFCATCGDTLKSRLSATKSAVPNPLSAHTVMRLLPGE